MRPRPRRFQARTRRTTQNLGGTDNLACARSCCQGTVREVANDQLGCTAGVCRQSQPKLMINWSVLLLQESSGW